MERANGTPAGRLSRGCAWALRTAAFAAALIIATLVLHRLFSMPTAVALNLFALAFALAGLAIVLALVGLQRIWSRGGRGAGMGLAALVLSAAILAWPMTYAPRAIAQAPLNDVTTDFENPPELTKAREQRPLGAQGVDYPGEIAARLQQELYPDLQPLVVDRPAAETFDLVVQAVNKLGMDVVRETEPENGGTGVVEAVTRTLIIGFRDDVAVRIIGRGDRSRVDFRSASRWGRHDFGRNATRVREMIRALLDRLESTVPAAEAGS
ncbi:MAG: DUF1499 domain-containing protein [Pseudomonadota bacterium]